MSHVSRHFPMVTELQGSWERDAHKVPAPLPRGPRMTDSYSKGESVNCVLPYGSLAKGMVPQSQEGNPSSWSPGSTAGNGLLAFACQVLAPLLCGQERDGRSVGRKRLPGAWPHNLVGPMGCERGRQSPPHPRSVPEALELSVPATCACWSIAGAAYWGCLRFMSGQFRDTASLQQKPDYISLRNHLG